VSKIVRVREPGKHVLRHPESGVMVVPDRAATYRTDDPLVLAFPWAFGTDDEIANETEERENVREVAIPRVEQATANPGERRAVRRGSRPIPADEPSGE
jgi:hypothetical protein